MVSLLVFIMVSFSMAFLIADARIFGCDTVSYKETPDDTEFIGSVGIFKIRPWFLRFHFFQELFSCYFCLGIWVGPVAHLLLYYALGAKYWFFHTPSQQDWILGYLLASLTSASGCYLVEQFAASLEAKVGE